MSHRKSSVFQIGFYRGFSRTEYRSRKLDFLGFESYTFCSPVGDINCRVPTFPLGRTVATVIPRLLFAMETRPRSIAHFRVTLKITHLLNELCTICRLILRHCIICPNNTLKKNDQTEVKHTIKITYTSLQPVSIPVARTFSFVCQNKGHYWT